LIGKKGKDAVVAGIAVYGPRTTVLLLCDEEVNEYTFKRKIIYEEYKTFFC